MADDQRKRYWWNLNIDPDKEADTGRWMMRTIAIWIGALVAVVVLLSIIFAVF